MDNLQSHGKANPENAEDSKNEELLYAEIEATPKADCPIAAIGSHIKTIHQRFDERYCLCDVVIESFTECKTPKKGFTEYLNDVSEPLDTDDTRIAQVKKEVTKSCICQIVLGYSSVPQCVKIEDGKFVMGVNVSNRQKLQEIMSDLKPVSETVQIISLSSLGCDQESVETTLIPHASDYLTEKQLIALRAAIRNGYYEFPRDCSLEEVANSLDISKTAVRKRLRGAEAKILGRTISET